VGQQAARSALHLRRLRQRGRRTASHQPSALPRMSQHRVFGRCRRTRGCRAPERSRRCAQRCRHRAQSTPRGPRALRQRYRIPFAAFTMPPLTTIRQNCHVGARALVEKLMRAARHEPNESMVIPTELVVRGSSLREHLQAPPIARAARAATSTTQRARRRSS
jgi:hypothetical protein